ncbi:MAG: CU044_2847 family protein [Halobacteriota archaeon]
MKRQIAEVAFGLVMKANIGAVLASAGIEANANIKLTWDFRGD